MRLFRWIRGALDLLDSEKEFYSHLEYDRDPSEKRRGSTSESDNGYDPTQYRKMHGASRLSADPFNHCTVYPFTEIFRMAVVTGLSFAGRTEEALNYYRDVLAAEIVFLMRFRDSPDKSFMQPGMEEMIFHATFRIDGTEMKASDVGYSEDAKPQVFSGFSLVLSPKSVEEADHIFASLSNGGEVVVPFGESSFTAWYGIVIDKFGVTWKLNVEPGE